MKSETLKGHLDALILSVLEHAPLHGYAVIAELKLRSGGELALPEGTVYPALHRLEDGGLLASAWSAAEGRRRRVYSLTGRGRRELGSRRGEWSRFAATVEAVLAPGQAAPA
jgi:PadR family transcriptional regulator PadR